MTTDELRSHADALQEGCGGFLWLANNLHNWDTQEFREMFLAAVADARRTYEAYENAKRQAT